MNMSTDYRTCECGETFADCADGVVFCHCGMAWCSEECAAVDGYREEMIVYEDGSKEEIRSCNFCRGDDFGDKELLEFVTSAIGVSRDDLVSHYKNYQKELSNGNTCTVDGYIRLKSFNTEANVALVEAVLGHLPTKIGVINE